MTAARQGSVGGGSPLFHRIIHLVIQVLGAIALVASRFFNTNSSAYGTTTRHGYLSDWCDVLPVVMTLVFLALLVSTPDKRSKIMYYLLIAMSLCMTFFEMPYQSGWP